MVENVCTMSDKRSMAAKPVEEGLMEERQKLIECIKSLLQSASNKEVRLAYIATTQIVRK